MVSRRRLPLRSPPPRRSGVARRSVGADGAGAGARAGAGFAGANCSQAQNHAPWTARPKVTPQPLAKIQGASDNVTEINVSELNAPVPVRRWWRSADSATWTVVASARTDDGSIGEKSSSIEPM